MRVLVLLCLVGVTLAGCSGSDDPVEGPTSAECLEQGLILNATIQPPMCVEPPFEIRIFEDPNHHCVVDQQRDRVHAPDLVGDPWVLGQSWDYNLVVDGEELGTTKLVYYDDQDFDGDVPQHYMVGTTTRDEALHHAIFSENPMIGRVHRILYSPHESGDHADMFHFPLCSGSSWQTVFYGETFSLKATEIAPADDPFGGPSDGRTFLIEGASADGGTLRLTYSSSAQWFTGIDLDRTDGGTVDMTLAGTATGYSGEAFFLRGQQDEVAAVSGTVLPGGLAALSTPLDTANVARQDGDDGPYDTVGINIQANLTGLGLARVEVEDPTGTVVYTTDLDFLTGEISVDDVIELPYQAGDWSLAVMGLTVDTATAEVTAQATFVSIYDRSGSV